MTATPDPAPMTVELRRLLWPVVCRAMRDLPKGTEGVDQAVEEIIRAIAAYQAESGWRGISTALRPESDTGDHLLNVIVADVKTLNEITDYPGGVQYRLEARRRSAPPNTASEGEPSRD